MLAIVLAGWLLVSDAWFVHHCSLLSLVLSLFMAEMMNGLLTMQYVVMVNHDGCNG